MHEDIEKEPQQRRADEEATDPAQPNGSGQCTKQNQSASTEQIDELEDNTVRQNNEFVFESHTSLSEYVDGNLLREN